MLSESGDLGSARSQQGAHESTKTDETVPMENEGSLTAKRNTRSKVNSEDTPQKRGRRRGKQQAVDQLSLTLSQIKQRKKLL